MAALLLCWSAKADKLLTAQGPLGCLAGPLAASAALSTVGRRLVLKMELGHPDAVSSESC